MKYVIGIGLLLLGLVVGYLFGLNREAAEVTENTTTEYITEVVHDTIVETKVVPVEEPIVEDSEEINDTLLLSDTLEISYIADTIIDDEYLSINREVLKKSAWIKVEVIEEQQTDSLLAEMMNVNTQLPDQILIEFWESPLDYSGYKLNRNKLILYGMPEQMNYRVYRKFDRYYFSTENIFYSIKETEEFLPYLEVEKSEIFQ